MNEYLKIGQIVTTHGVKGEVKVYPLTEDIKRFSKLKFAFIKNKDIYNKLDVENVKYFNKMVILKIKGIDDMNSSLKLKDEYLYIDRENAIKLPKDSYFICDLIGLDVYSTDGEKLGKIKQVLTLPSNDVYEVEQTDGKTFLVPAISEFIRSIELNNNKIIIKLVEGLL